LKERYNKEGNRKSNEIITKRKIDYIRFFERKKSEAEGVTDKLEKKERGAIQKKKIKSTQKRE
jgi:hypothetical protein